VAPSLPLSPYSLVPVAVDSELFRPFVQAVRRVFGDHETVDDAWYAARQATYGRQRLLAVLDGDVVAGTYRSWDLDLSVPGGCSVRADAISSVTVQPTHRRRGVLTSLITHDLRDAHERGVPVAVLIASEAPIYGRYGFGAATESATWTVDVRAARLRPPAAARAAGIRVEHVSDAELLAVAPELYGRARGPGDIDRWDNQWRVLTGNAEGDPQNAKPGVAAVARDLSGAVQGVLRLTIEQRWQEHAIASVAEVGLLDTATADAHVALWSYLTNLDLVSTVRAEDRAVDDPLPWLLTDRRAARQGGRSDFLWTRVLDVPATLTGRRYETPGAVVLEVRDGHGWADGRFALEVAADGTAACAPTGAPADLELPVDVLGAVWLGGTDLRGAAAAGLVAGDRAAVDRAAAMFRTSTAPWSSTWF
jgi:predicted acetyltransferase